MSDGAAASAAVVEVAKGTRDAVSSPRTVVKSILNAEQGEGVGARVRRSIGSYELRNLDPFLMLDFFNVSSPAGFPDHPHRGFETVTYMTSGTMLHEDFCGHKGSIGPGSLQWMTAGRGIMHSEIPLPGEPARGLQLWVNLAEKDKMVEPAYQELDVSEVPQVEVEGVRASVIAGKCLGVESPVRTRTPTMYLDISLEKGASIEQPIPAGWNAFAFLIEGKLQPSPGADPVSEWHTLVFSNKASQDGVTLEAPADASARVVLIAGKPLKEPVVQHGPMVATSREGILKAMQDFSRGENGFERAPGWSSEIAKKYGTG